MDAPILPPRAPLAALLAVAAASLLAGCEGDVGAPSPAGGAAPDDRAYLAALALVDPKNNDYVNLRRATMLEEMSRAATTPLDRFRFLHLAADERVKGGESAKGIEELDALLAQMPEQGTPLALEIETALRHSIAIASLRLGELENCIEKNCCDSCVFPIEGGGVHTEEEGSRRAIAEVDWLLARQPDRTDYRWLRNLLAMTVGEWPDGVPERFRIAPSVFASEAEIPRHLDVAAKVGIEVSGLSGGACLDDFDGDGLLDLFITSWGLGDPSRFFRADGRGKFEERTEAAGLRGIVGGLNCLHADYDNDGDHDILILRGAWLRGAGRHPNTLLRNDGGRFVDVTVAAGILSFHPTQTGAWGDYDLDGDLDLFIGNESSQGSTHPCELYENQGNGTFVDVAASVGVANVSFVKGAVWGDIDNDGDLDLYLSVLAGPNQLYENLGKPAGASGRPRFREIGAAAGVTEPKWSFPTWFFDYDQDGWLDILAASFDEKRIFTVIADYLDRPEVGDGIRLYRNRGDRTFEDVSVATGLRHSVLAMGSNFGDIDADGWLDVFFGTGDPEFGTLIPNRMFRNDGGQRFLDVTTAGGFGHLQKGHGIAFGDIDQDGDEDIFLKVGGAYQGDYYPSVLYENPSAGHRWVTLRLEGRRSSRDAHDARVRIELDTPDGPRTLHRVVGTGGSFGASSLQLEVGLGNATAIRSVSVHWPVSGRSEHTGFQLDRTYRIIEGDSAPKLVETAPIHLGGA